MSKPYYETEEYIEAENELDTYDDKVKLIMEYRVSEKHKDQQITDLQSQLAITEKALELVCSDAHGIAIECEGYYFGACSEKTFNWFEDLSKEEKIKAHCNYFLNKAKEMLEDESK